MGHRRLAHNLDTQVGRAALPYGPQVLPALWAAGPLACIMGRSLYGPQASGLHYGTAGLWPALRAAGLWPAFLHFKEITREPQENVKPVDAAMPRTYLFSRLKQLLIFRFPLHGVVDAVASAWVIVENPFFDG